VVNTALQCHPKSDILPTLLASEPNSLTKLSVLIWSKAQLAKQVKNYNQTLLKNFEKVGDFHDPTLNIKPSFQKDADLRINPIPNTSNRMLHLKS